jgi:hypothetical protein
VDQLFRWNADNIEHISTPGIGPYEAEHIVRCAGAPFPRDIGDGKHLVWGLTAEGTYLQVIFIYSPPDVIYVIHARVLTADEK